MQMLIGNYALNDYVKYMKDIGARTYVNDDHSITAELQALVFNGASIRFMGDGVIEVYSQEGIVASYDDHAFYRKNQKTGKYFKPDEYIEFIVTDCTENGCQYGFRLKSKEKRFA